MVVGDHGEFRSRPQVRVGETVLVVEQRGEVGAGEAAHRRTPFGRVPTRRHVSVLNRLGSKFELRWNNTPMV